MNLQPKSLSPSKPKSFNSQELLRDQPISTLIRLQPSFHPKPPLNTVLGRMILNSEPAKFFPAQPISNLASALLAGIPTSTFSEVASKNYSSKLLPVPPHFLNSSSLSFISFQTPTSLISIFSKTAKHLHPTLSSLVKNPPLPKKGNHAKSSSISSKIIPVPKNARAPTFLLSYLVFPCLQKSIFAGSTSQPPISLLRPCLIGLLLCAKLSVDYYKTN